MAGSPELDRLARDFTAATGTELELSLRERDGLDVIMVTLAGQPAGSFWKSFPHEHEPFLAEVAGDLQEFLSQEVWGGWPICATHNTHPLDPTVIDGTASWVCPLGQFTARIGDLGRS